MRKFLEKLNKEKGITLTALVITVVIMLILVGVAIATIVDENGLFDKARQATETYEQSSHDESDQIKTLMNEIDNYLDEAPKNDNPIYTENKTYDGQTTGTYNNPIIPKGFAPVNENGAIWGSSDGYKKGLVITDAVDESGNSIGNEFVWVPVDGTNVTFDRIEWGTGLYEKNDCLETVPTEITTSVINNEGFYIARYEAGIANNIPQEALTSDSTLAYGDGTYKPVSKQNAYVWNYIYWGENDEDTNPGKGAVTVAKSMYPNEDSNYGAISTLIYGIQWDTALKFIEAYDIGELGYDIYATDSTGLGNHFGMNGEDDIDSYWNSEEDNSGPAKCGVREAFRQKNIYDMAGNVWEWTMEKYMEYRINRGGDYSYPGSECPSSSRANCNVNYGYSFLRFPCCTLYKIINYK